MFEIKKELIIAGSHHLDLPYESPCCSNHGHNWRITIWLRSNDEHVDNNNGMILDFKTIKEKIHGVLDHKNLNEIVDFNPTAENLARWICQQIDFCYKVEVEESPNNTAIYIDEQIE